MSVEQRMAELERELRSLKTAKNNLKNKQAKNVYYSVPVYTTLDDGRETITNILYTHDKFEPGETKCRIWAPSGESQVVYLSEYMKLKDNKNWFDSEWEAKASIKKAEKKSKVSKEDIVGMLQESASVHQELN